MFTIVQAVSTSKTSRKRSYEFETSVTIVRMSCDNVAINKKHKVHMHIYIYSIYIYIYISNWIIEHIYIQLYSCTVNVNLMLIFTELSELIIYCKYT